MNSLLLKKYAAFISAIFQGFFLIYFADLAIIEVAMAILLCLGAGFPDSQILGAQKTLSLSGFCTGYPKCRWPGYGHGSMA